MRNKIIEIFVLLSIGISAFFMPLTAYAAEIPDTSEPPVTASVSAVGTETPDVPVEVEPGDNTDIEDMESGDMSDFLAMLKLFGALGAADGEAEQNYSYTPKPFTPDGQATVIDWATEYDGKEFYTFLTPAGNPFYLIIDHARENNNVYFLNAVTESDLIALAEKAGEPVGESAIPTTEKPPAETENPSETEPPGGMEDKPKDGGGNSGMIIFLVIALIAVGGAGYYIKIVRPKQQAANTDDDEDEAEGENDRDYPYEDETDGNETVDDDGDEYEVFENTGADDYNGREVNGNEENEED